MKVEYVGKGEKRGRERTERGYGGGERERKDMSVVYAP